MSNNKVHVALVNISRVVNAKGGTEKVFCDMANALVEKGYEVSAFYFDEDCGSPGFYISNKVHLINAFYKPWGYVFRKLITYLGCFFCSKEKRNLKNKEVKLTKYKTGFLRAIAKIKRPDIFISYSPEVSYILIELLKIKVPIITMFHFNPNHFIEKDDFKLYINSLNKSNVLQVLMPDYVNDLSKVTKNKNIVYIPNVAPSYRTQSKLNNKVIITVGRVDPQKRTTLLVEAFNLIKDKFPDWRCEWLGESINLKYRKQVEDLINRFDLSKQIKFPGKTESVSKKLERASIFAFPSEFEGFSLALAEAFAMGLPAIGCKDCPSVNRLIRNMENGLLTESSPEAFAKALAYLMENVDERERMGNQARKDMQEYSAEKVWSSWDFLIKEVLIVKNPLN